MGTVPSGSFAQPVGLLDCYNNPGEHAEKGAVDGENRAVGGENRAVQAEKGVVAAKNEREIATNETGQVNNSAKPSVKDALAVRNTLKYPENGDMQPEKCSGHLRSDLIRVDPRDPWLKKEMGNESGAMSSPRD